jgi:hypothetical protein
MATYGVKYELFFQDVEERRLKVEILKKGYTGSVSELVGTDNPVEIIWSGDDDIYSPIIGSRCKLNLFATDDTNYEDFFRGDEREYKVKVLRYGTTGNFIEAEGAEWQTVDAIWDEVTGGQLFYQPIWEGFMVIDRFKEQMVSKPYPITIEAVDGLGTLDGFDAPFDDSDNTTTSDLFYYLKEILLLTGHEHRIYISNDTRKDGGATNDTIFHDIVVDKYALFTKNLTFRTAKDVLKQILRITNSRIYHSLARWYIVNNSSLIDTRIDQLAEAPSGEDTNIEPEPPIDPFETVELPNIQLLANSSTASSIDLYVGQHVVFSVNRVGGGEIDTFSWTTPKGSSTTAYLSFTAEASHDGETVSVTCTNSEGSDSDSCTINILQDQNNDPVDPPDPPDPVDPDVEEVVGGEIKVYFENQIANTGLSQPNPYVYAYEAYQVGNNNALALSVTIVPNSNYQFTSASQYDVALVGTNSNVTVSKSASVGVFNVSAIFPEDGGYSITVRITGTVPVKQHTTIVNFVNNVGNTTFDVAPFYFTGEEGTSFSETRTLMPDDDYFFSSLGNVGAILTYGQFVNRSLLLKTRDASGKNPIDVTVSGTIQGSNKTDTLTLGGSPKTSNDATGVTSGVTISTAETVAGYATYLFTSNYISNPSNLPLFNGKFRVVAHTVDGTNRPVDWVYISPTQGDEDTRQVELRFTGNYSYGGTRYAHIKFLAFNSGTVLHQLNITQTSLTVF